MHFLLFLSPDWLTFCHVIIFLFLSDEGPMLETLDYTIRIGRIVWRAGRDKNTSCKIQDLFEKIKLVIAHTHDFMGKIKLILQNLNIVRENIILMTTLKV